MKDISAITGLTPFADMVRRVEAARKRKKGIRLKSWEVVILHCALNCMESRLKGEALDKSIQKAKAES